MKSFGINISIFRLFSMAYIVFCTTSLSAQGNPTARYEIEAKRIGVDMLGKDAIPRSREFIRLDSTYYVGYMYEGMYKSDRSSDYIGFRNAIPPLRKAFVLLQKDYRRGLKSIFTSPEAYLASMNKYRDFLIISDALRQSYDNVEMPDSVMWVLNQVTSYRFPKDHIGANSIKAWTYHRNRFFTSAKFAFLKNSVEENEQEAFGYCYKALNDIKVHKAANDLWFGPSQAETDRLNVYHYLALLHNYNKNYDSSEYYYKILAQNSSVSWNNFGGLKHEIGEFSVAREYYDRDKYKYAQKTLREPFYFIPILDIYAGRTKHAMSLCKEAIDYAGSTPGFGWYNIALARSYMYDGQLDSASLALQKAADFKELHIGTTLTQSQYDFTINLLRLQLIDRKMSLVKFLHTGWWYSPVDWYHLVILKFQKIMQEYVLINQMMTNPERDRTIYELFCGESTTTYDEAYYLLQDFSPTFFTKKFIKYQTTDKRKSILRYFQLFQHQMEWENGDEDDAYKGYTSMVEDIKLDTTNEKLFLCRLYEGLSKASKEKGEGNTNFYTNAMFEQYPQLVPFSGIALRINLTTSGILDKTTEAVLSELNDCNIDWVSDQDGNTAKAFISFTKKGDKYEAVINVTSGSGIATVTNEKMIFKEPEGAGKEIALRLFGKGGSKVFEKPEIDK